MSNTKPFEQSELIRLALAGIDAEIADLQEKRARLAGMTTEQSPQAKEVSVAPPTKKGGKMSEEAKAKISAAAKKRWAKVKRANAETAKSATAKKARSKKSAVKAQTASKKGKKRPAKKAAVASVAPSTETA